MSAFNPYGIGGVIISFPCINCETPIKTKEIIIPAPDYSADNDTDSNISILERIICPNPECKKHFDIIISIAYYGGNIQVSDTDESKISIETIVDPAEQQYYEDYYGALADKDRIYLSFLESMTALKKLNKLTLPDESLNQILRKQIFVSIIAALEAFLSEAFIKLTLHDKESLKAFIETYPEFKNRKFELKDIFDAYDKIEETAKVLMMDIIYHNLPKVKLMYESTFKIRFPDIVPILKAIQIRHDLVHRNGKTKSGGVHLMSVETINEYLGLIEYFVTELVNVLLFKPIDVTDTKLMGELEFILGKQ